MKPFLMTSLAALALASCGLGAQAADKPAPTPAEAKAFITKAEADLAKANTYAAKAAWVRATYITEDTQWLEAKAGAEQNEMATRLAKQAARYNAVKVDAVTRRKLDLLKRSLVLPAPDRPGAADALATIASRLDSTISPPMRKDYADLISMANEGSRSLGYKDTGALWRSGYDMNPDAFAKETDRLWTQVQPFYKNLHCYVRARLNEKYGDLVQARTGPIRADLLGNMWAQEWGHIYDVVAPKTQTSSYNLDQLLLRHGYDPIKMVKTGEGFYSSVGMAALPQSFWERSQITRPRDREVVCHASAWDIDDRSDIRIKMCTQVTAEDFVTIHHELGHNYYQRAYQDQPFLFKGGANDGFHEAIGDFAALSVLTPTYLKQIGLLETVPGAEEDMPFLLKTAMDKIAFLPFGLLVDKWRWQVFSGQVQPDQYNDAWWALVNQYQGLAPPSARPANAFDPGAKYHVPGNTPYMRYFLARIYQFQFHRAACEQAGWTGPLHRCSIYGNEKIGKKFNAMMEMGQSKPWPDALEAFTGQRQTDASALTEYFKPLDAWLTEQNKGETCGW